MFNFYPLILFSIHTWYQVGATVCSHCSPATTGQGCSANVLFAKEAMVLNAMGEAISMNGTILTRGRVAVRRGAACGSLANYAPKNRLVAQGTRAFFIEFPEAVAIGARDDAAVLMNVTVRPTLILAKVARQGANIIKARQHPFARARLGNLVAPVAAAAAGCGGILSITVGTRRWPLWRNPSSGRKTSSRSGCSQHCRCDTAAGRRRRRRRRTRNARPPESSGVGEGY